MSSEKFRGSFVSRLALAALIALAVLPAAAQEPSVPRITFTLDFPGAEPDHYVISVAADGHASYDSSGKAAPQAESGDPYHLEFTVSQTTCARVFDLARRSHYFEGNADSGKKNIALTGAKTLAYHDASRNHQTTYNYSPIASVMELTNIFQNLSTTLEFGRRLEYLHRYQKLALDEELKHMEELSKGNQLAEILAVGPVLQDILSDNSLLNLVRARAQRLLAAGQK